jgi:hypothetical protein
MSALDPFLQIDGADVLTPRALPRHTSSSTLP